ncbi:MAG: hypothetical protein R3B95_20380 [Nitrospirales bacterium]|nr:hypothetical protein [Nitrospirales bacterium]
MREISVSPDGLQEEINELRQAVLVSGIPEHSLMEEMLRSSLEQLERAFAQRDFQTVQHGLQSTKALLLQCTI